MLRVLRIVGIIVFVFLAGMSANTLREMYRSGELMEEYNSSRKANITLLCFSGLVLGGLGCLEVSYLRHRNQYRGYDRSVPASPESNSDPALRTDLYGAPKTQDEWNKRRKGSSRNHHRRHKRKIAVAEKWRYFLCGYGVVLSLIFISILTAHFLIEGFGQELDMLTLIFGVLSVTSVLTVTGIMLKKKWGLFTGYISAICCLLIFPLGTAAALFLLIALIGVTPLFAASERQRRRREGGKSAKKMKTAAI